MSYLDYRPLSSLSRAESKGLCQALWDWNRYCPDCPDSSTNDLESICHKDDSECPWKRRFHAKRAFIEFYKKAAQRYPPLPFSRHAQVIHKHQDLFDIIAFLRRADPNHSRSKCMDLYFDPVPSNDRETPICREKAFLLAARILTMIGVTMYGERAWYMNESLNVVVTNSFPPDPLPIPIKDRRWIKIRDELTAYNLVTTAKLKIRPTDEVQNHLKLDKQGNLFIFHHVGFIAECLRVDNDRRRTEPGYKSPHFPREVGLEILHTLRVLFHQLDEDGRQSRKLLRKLIANSEFDPLSDEDVVWFYTDSEDEGNRVQAFPVFGGRLMALNDEIENPKPRTAWDKWLHRHSSPQHALMLALLSLVLTLVPSVLSLAASIIQTVLAWKQQESGK
ncbi:hypothetical protein QBC47DRAFT_461995 [Echria macrotheca]|uniref:Uncharacterized protein n=1 Tax=Echria macrotheca TaxID=438768 RepID=A0AAJ0FAC5_9PEZI|nr:hypothetical protein QBC47DRAFT_461995 [Echria macrotheca]